MPRAKNIKCHDAILSVEVCLHKFRSNFDSGNPIYLLERLGIKVSNNLFGIEEYIMGIDNIIRTRGSDSLVAYWMSLVAEEFFKCRRHTGIVTESPSIPQRE